MNDSEILKATLALIKKRNALVNSVLLSKISLDKYDELTKEIDSELKMLREKQLEAWEC